MKEVLVDLELIERKLSAKEAIYQLLHTPIGSIFTREEIEVINKINPENYKGPYIGDSIVAVMKATRLCNLRCKYCHSWKEGPNEIMKFDILVKSILGILNAEDMRVIDFTWHGGETTILPIEFYLKVLWLQHKYKSDKQVIKNAIQTNGTMLSDKWIKFLKKYDFSVGVSMDGPEEIQDKYRVDKLGRPTSQKVRASIKSLIENNINFGVLMVLDYELIKLGSERILSYLVDCGVKAVAILNVIPENTKAGQPIKGNYLDWDTYMTFLKDLFVLWFSKYKDKINVRELSSLLSNIENKGVNKNTICIYAGKCMGKYITIEPDGTVSSCDKYIGDSDYIFTNLKYLPLSVGMSGSKNLENVRHITAEETELLDKSCKYFSICNGGCPHDFRLNNMYNKNFSNKCCGLSSLIEHMNDYLSINQL
jgi:uncharacterized protein